MEPGDADPKWRLANRTVTNLKDKLAEVLIVAMFLGTGLYIGISVGKPLATSLHEVAIALTISAEQDRASQSSRQHEHEDIRADLKECMEMGHALSECQQRERRQ